MIDTIRGKISTPWKDGIFDNVIPKWKMTQKNTIDNDGNESTSWSALHEDGTYIAGNEDCANIIQTSLPRLIFKSDNTNLIKNQDDLDEAISTLRYLMQQVLVTDSIPRWTRIDFVWNFVGNINEYIACFKTTKHPAVRSAVRIYESESIAWLGKYTKIKIYDKIKEKTKRSDTNRTIVRAEIQKTIRKPTETEDLIMKLCNRVLGGYVPSFDKCYRYYRELMILLSPKDIPKLSSRSPLDFLAFLQANGLTDPQGVPLVDLYLSNKSKASKYRIMRQLKGHVLRHKFISFHAMLPEENPPRPITYSDLVRCA